MTADCLSAIKDSGFFTPPVGLFIATFLGGVLGAAAALFGVGLASGNKGK